MNELANKFGDKLVILGVPCNQFGHQTNEDDTEFMNCLKYVRPGKGFEPKCEIFSKVHVNGRDAKPLFKFVKSAIPIPYGEGDAGTDTKGNGVADNNILVRPRDNFNDTLVVPWAPIARNDIAWNFEKFLIDKEGKVVQRFGRYFQCGRIAPFIEKLV
mmetsp:Transcript_53349/g.130335  ORF Transcript_53349/g.130335 Transcript_53349/m.130335 type:complete len:158 (+) Transcript_53349:168-641(+)